MIWASMEPIAELGFCPLIYLKIAEKGGEERELPAKPFELSEE